MVLPGKTKAVPEYNGNNGVRGSAEADWLQAVSAHGGHLDRRRLHYQIWLLGADVVLGAGALLLADYLVGQVGMAETRPALVPHVMVLVACWVAVTFINQLYTLTARPLLMRLLESYAALFIGTLAAIAVTFLISPDWLGLRLFYVVAYMVAALLYAMTRAVAAAVVAEELITKRVAIVGTVHSARQVIKHLATNGEASSYCLVGVVLTDEEAQDPEEIEGLPVIAGLNECPGVLLQRLINTLIISRAGPFSDEVARCLAHCDAVGIQVMRFEVGYEALTQQAAVFNVGPDWLASLETVRYNKYATRLKRVLDVVITILLLPLAGLMVGLCALLIKLLSPGPVLYHQTRVGKDGQHFALTKLRTMVPNAEKDTGPVWATKDDPRITGIGRFLRMMRLDELPQLVQVLRGNMSLIGPRPERPEIVDRLKQDIPLYEKRLIVRPGITGWAQVNHKYDSNTEDVIQKLRYDLYYIRNLSFGLDLQILLRTVGVVLAKRGAQ